MVKEYLYFIKEYLKIAEIKASYLWINFLSAFFYKLFWFLLPLISSYIIKYLTLQNKDMSYLFLCIFILCYLLYNLSLYINYKIYGFNMNLCYGNLQTRMLKKLERVEHNFSRNINKGRLINTVNSDILAIGDMNDRISEIITGLLHLLAILVMVFTKNIFLAIIFILFTLIYITLKNNADRMVNLYHNKVVIQDDKYSNLLTQIVNGLQEIKTFHMLENLMKKLDVIQNRFTKYYNQKSTYYTIRDNDVKVIIYITRTILYLLLMILLMKGKTEISVLILIISYHEQLITVIDETIDSTATVRETHTSIKRVSDILNYKEDNYLFGNVLKDDIYGAIEFRGVSLTIDKKEILKNINLKINHNQVVAIVGEPGSGKTSLFNLLLRIYQPTKGMITIDDIPINDFSSDIYSKNIGIVNQAPFVFNMSIRKNLDFVDKNINHQIEACKRAGIHDFIETLPNGYQTVLRENGNNISGGQKQMISIARTILTDCEILLFDDITTFLDPDTAKLVPRLIKNLKKDHTIIMTTKKPELMKEASLIVVLNDGKIEAVGTHKELIKTCEIYETLQSRKSPSRMGVFDHDSIL